jgi:hypothetical protein
MMTLAVSTLAQQKNSQHNTTKVSRGFAQAANKALVAIGNSVNDDALTRDPVVQQAFNDADAVAFSKPETEVMTRLTLLSAMRPLELSMLKYTDPESEKHKKAFSDLHKTDACITAMRQVLHSLSGDEPKECKEELP